MKVRMKAKAFEWKKKSRVGYTSHRENFGQDSDRVIGSNNRRKEKEEAEDKNNMKIWKARKGMSCVEITREQFCVLLFVLPADEVVFVALLFGDYLLFWFGLDLTVFHYDEYNSVHLFMSWPKCTEQAPDPSPCRPNKTCPSTFQSYIHKLPFFLIEIIHSNVHLRSVRPIMWRGRTYSESLGQDKMKLI